MNMEGYEEKLMSKKCLLKLLLLPEPKKPCPKKQEIENEIETTPVMNTDVTCTPAETASEKPEDKGCLLKQMLLCGTQSELERIYREESFPGQSSPFSAGSGSNALSFGHHSADPGSILSSFGHGSSELGSLSEPAAHCSSTSVTELFSYRSLAGSILSTSSGEHKHITSRKLAAHSPSTVLSSYMTSDASCSKLFPGSTSHTDTTTTSVDQSAFSADVDTEFNTTVTENSGGNVHCPISVTLTSPVPAYPSDFGSAGDEGMNVDFAAQGAPSVDDQAAASSSDTSVTCQPSSESEPAPPAKKKKRDENAPKRTYTKIKAKILRGELPYVCKECGAGFTHLGSYKRHLASHTGDRPHVCTECGQGFVQKSDLKTHIMTHTGEKPYKCTYCDAAFNRVDNMNRHIKIHTGERHFMCELCQSTFVTAANLKAHMLTHTGLRPFVCQQCGGAFTTLGNLKTHSKTHSGERPHVCKRCGKSYCTFSQLKIHNRIHTGERPYVCEQCEASFITSGNLKKHKEIHMGYRPFVCTQCGFAFTRACHLKRHMGICLPVQFQPNGFTDSSEHVEAEGESCAISESDA